MEKQKENIPDCCKPKKSSGLVSGIIYGAVPHAGCIAFILFSILGMTFAASLFKPFLAKAYFFYIMVGLSLIFATISAFFYLSKHGGVKTLGEHKGYLSILYGSTIAVSLILYMFVFPLVANVSAQTNSGSTSIESETISLKVAIPCPGHAPLIIDELNKVSGVENVKFEFPNKFTVTYNSAKTSKNTILSLDIFKEYKAQPLS